MIEIGDKYILEVTGKLECQNVDKNGKYIDNGTLWNTNVGHLFSTGVLNKIERCEGKQGTTLEEIRKTAYEKGLNDAWEAATKMVSEKEDGGFSRDELLEIFGTKSILCVFADNTAKEAISKIRAYEEKKKEKAKKAQDKIRNHILPEFQELYKNQVLNTSTADQQRYIWSCYCDTGRNAEMYPRGLFDPTPEDLEIRRKAPNRAPEEYKKQRKAIDESKSDELISELRRRGVKIKICQ